MPAPSETHAVIGRPLPTDRSEVYGPFFRGLREGRIVVQRCTSCSTKHWPPREMCGVCHAEAMEWVDVATSGEVYTFTVSYRAFHPAFLDAVPYGVVTVDVGEGVRVFGEYGGPDVEALACGQRVTAEFVPVTNEVTVLRWVPEL